MNGYNQSHDYGYLKPSWVGIIAAILIFIAAILPEVYARAGDLRGTADKVVDGDTLWICDEHACTKVRLCGVNAPERGDVGYHDSKAALIDLVKGKAVRCVQVGDGTPCDGRSKPTNRDRIVAQCFVGDLDLAGVLVAQGHASDWMKFSGGVYSEQSGANYAPGLALIVVGLVVALGIPLLVVGRFQSWVRRKSGVHLKVQHAVPVEITGTFERALAFILTAFHVDGTAALLAGWIVAKLAANWQRWPVGDHSKEEQRQIRAQTFIALMTGIVSVGFGVVGGLLARRGAYVLWPMIENYHPAVATFGKLS